LLAYGWEADDLPLPGANLSLWRHLGMSKRPPQVRTIRFSKTLITGFPSCGPYTCFLLAELRWWIPWMTKSRDEALQDCFKNAQWLAFYKAELIVLSICKMHSVLWRDFSCICIPTGLWHASCINH
jgi:hypothetical protein